MTRQSKRAPERSSRNAGPARKSAPRAAGPSTHGNAGGVDYGRLDGLLGYHLRKAQQATFQSFAQHLAGENVSPGQLGVLLVVSANPGVNQTTVGAAMGIDRSTLVSVIDRLEGRGILERTPSPTDRRSHALVLTPAGERYLDKILPLVEKHEDELAGNLSAPERRTLVALLRRIRST